MRFERKYCITHMGAESVAALVKGHALSFREAYADRQVNNVYLDDIELGDFMENLYGLSQRRKFRIRWYGEEMLAVRKPVLEVKVRSEGLGDKYFYPLGDFALGGPVELRQHVSRALDRPGHGLLCYEPPGRPCGFAFSHVQRSG